MKALGVVRKEQHIVYRVLARSTMRFRYDLQTGAVTVDGARLVDNGPRGSRLARYRTGWRPLASYISRDVHCSADGPRAAPDCVRDCSSMTCRLQLLIYGVERPDVELFISSTAACAAAPHEVAVLHHGTLNTDGPLETPVDSTDTTRSCSL